MSSELQHAWFPHEPSKECHKIRDITHSLSPVTEELFSMIKQWLLCDITNTDNLSFFVFGSYRDWSTLHLLQMSWSQLMVNPMRESTWSRPRGGHRVSPIPSILLWQILSLSPALWLSDVSCLSYTVFFSFNISVFAVTHMDKQVVNRYIFE